MEHPVPTVDPAREGPHIQSGSQEPQPPLKKVKFHLQHPVVQDLT